MTLLERTGELAALDGLIEAAVVGEGRLMMIEGPAGIGKSALLEVARERARAAALRVFTARAGQLESSCSYGVVRQWLGREWPRSTGALAVTDPAGLVLSRVPRPANAPSCTKVPVDSNNVKSEAGDRAAWHVSARLEQ